MRPSHLFVLCLLVARLSAQFGPAQIVFESAVGEPYFVHASDLDGDGAVDVVTDYQNENILAWQRNLGAGLWDAPHVISALCPNYATWRPADVDSDGDIDILFKEGTSPSVISWLENDGAGAFGVYHSILDSSGLVAAVDVGDVDSDGDQDLLYSAATTLSWLPNDGSGNFGTPLLVDSLPAVATEILSEDLDSDGDEDLLVIRDYETVVYENISAGVFSDSPLITGMDHLAIRLRLANVDMDGLPDIVATIDNGNLEVAWSRNLGNLLYGTSQVIPGMASSVLLPIEATDLDGDGDADLLPSTGSTWERNDGTGDSWTHMVIDTLTPSMHACAADLEQDGDADVLMVRGGTIWSFTNSGEGIIAFSSLLPSLLSVNSINSVDVDGDELIDLVSSSRYHSNIGWYKNMGSAGFAPQRTIAPTDVEALDFADIDNDGLIDPVVAVNNSVAWYRNEGGGAFGLPDSIGPYTGLAFATGLDCDDLDADGDIDVAIVMDAGTIDHVLCYMNDGTGGFTSASVVSNQVQTPVSVRIADLDEDGDQDLLVSSLGEGKIIWFQNNGFGSFSGALLVAMVSSDFTTAFDVDADGDEDVVSSSYAGIQWFQNSGDGVFGTAVQTIPNCGNDKDLRPCDVDSDGDLDIVTVSLGVPAWLENEGGLLSAPQIMDSQFAGPLVATGDFDNDVDVDVAAVKTFGISRVCWFENFFGSPYRIEGRIFVDNDANGSFTIGDHGVEWAPIISAPMASIPLSDQDGSYIVYADSGTYVFQPALPSYWSSDPANRWVPLTADEPVSPGNDFILSALLDTSIIIPGLTRNGAPCGDTTSMWVSFANQGTRIEHGSVVLTLDNELAFVSSEPSPTALSGNTITWDFDSLLFFEIGVIHLTVQLPGSNLVGDTLIDHVSIIALDDLDDTTHVFSTDQTRIHGCSFDPNDKQASPAGIGELGILPVTTDQLDYTIRFQNTGTDTAYSVVIQDQLDVPLDRSSVHVLGYSSPPTHVQVEQDGGLLVRFDNILLPDSGADVSGSQGFITFRIGLQEGLPNFTEIINTAGIYFDNNDAVVTNTTINTLVDCDLFTATIGWFDIDLLQASDADGFQWFLDGDSLIGENEEFLTISIPGSYTVATSSIYGCSSVSEPYQVIALGTKLREGYALYLAPNPTSNGTVLVIPAGGPRIGRLEVFDGQGRMLRSSSGLEGIRIPVPVEGLARGIYFTRALTLDGTALPILRLIID